MTDKVDRAFIRRGVEQADLDAVRAALVQLTRDAALATLPLASKLDAAQRERLIDQAVDWLDQHAGSWQLPEPEEADLRALMEMATGAPMGDLEFAARRDLTGFRPYPYAQDWGDDKPDIPEDFRAVIVGSGIAGMTMAVQLDILGVPYTVIERRPEPGGVWSINRYPEVRVDTISITYAFLFERDHVWMEYFGRGEQVRDYAAYISQKYGISERTRFSHDLKEARFDEARDGWVLDIATPDGSVQMEANVLLSCSGLFATSNVPYFEGREDFRGEIVHTAQWPEGTEARDRRDARGLGRADVD